MFDWIPGKYYTDVHYFIMLMIFLFAYSTKVITDKELQTKISRISNATLVYILFYMGFRPLYWQFMDMLTYADNYRLLQEGIELKKSHDLFFFEFMKFCTRYFDVNTFFFIIACLYVIPLLLASKKWFKSYWGFAFLILIGSFSFWPYGTNGIRNGVATSMVLLGFAYSDKKHLMAFFFFLGISFHSSVIIPIAAFVGTFFYNDSKKFLYFWLACIPLSLIGGGFWEVFFSSLGVIEDGRLSYLTSGNINNDKFSATGFRWDFLMYSAAAVYAGYYFIFKRGFQDKIYSQLFNTYLIANGFWILVIRANFSNRFAYLSWFMMGIVIIYPFLKKQFFENQTVVLSRVLWVYYAFTFFMFVILG